MSTGLLEERSEVTDGTGLASSLRPLWVAWEPHRRSRELADALGSELHILLSDQAYLLRVVVLALRTGFLLASRRPRLLFVQNPSMALAALACWLRRPLRYRLVVDRHSNFRLQEAGNRALRWRVFHFLSRYTIRAADLTIVTNDALRELVETWGGRGFVLPDRVPRLPLRERRAAVSMPQVVFICSHEEDEPIAEVLEAAAHLPGVRVAITGNPARTLSRYAPLVPANVEFTGHLPEAEYQSLIASADLILSLTKAPNTILCGAYEAVAVGTPLVLSNQPALTAYFSKGRVVADNSATDLERAIARALKERPRLLREIQELKAELEESWGLQRQELLRSLDVVDR